MSNEEISSLNVKMESDTVVPKLSVYYSTISCLFLSLIYVGSLYVWRSEHNRYVIQFKSWNIDRKIKAVNKSCISNCSQNQARTHTHAHAVQSIGTVCNFFRNVTSFHDKFFPNLFAARREMRIQKLMILLLSLQRPSNDGQKTFFQRFHCNVDIACFHLCFIAGQ